MAKRSEIILLKKIIQKKAQVTAFIVFGILLLVVVLVLFFVLNANGKEIKTDTKSTDVGIVQQFLSSCAEQVSLFAAYKAGVQGGRITMPQQHFASVTPLAYGYLFSPTIPLSTEVQQEITSFIQQELETCYAVLRNFPQLNIGHEGESFVDVSVNKKDVFVKIQTPLQFTSGQNKETRSVSYTNYLAIPLLTTLDQTRGFLDAKQDNLLSMDALLDMDANTTIFTEKDHIVFAHQMHESKSMHEKPFLFAYVVKLE